MIYAMELRTYFPFLAGALKACTAATLDSIRRHWKRRTWPQHQLLRRLVIQRVQISEANGYAVGSRSTAWLGRIQGAPYVGLRLRIGREAIEKRDVSQKLSRNQAGHYIISP